MWKNAYFFFDNSCSVWGCKRTVNWNRLSILGTAKHIDKNNTVIQRARNIRSFSLTHTHTLVVKCACVVPMTLFTPHQEAKLQQSHGNGNGGAPHCTVRTSGKKLMVHLRPLFFYNHLSFNILWQTAPCPGSCSFKGGLETFSTPAASSPSVPPYKPSPAPVSMVSRVLKCKSMWDSGPAVKEKSHQGTLQTRQFKLRSAANRVPHKPHHLC